MTLKLGSRWLQGPAQHKAPRSLAALAAIALLAFSMHASGQQAATRDARETLGPGDTVRVTVFQNPDLTTEARISERGTIVFPLIGETSLKGKTPAAAGTVIADKLKKGQFLKNPQVTVALTTVRSRQVSVLGHVARPGRYTLEDSARLTDILALAGGVANTGDDVITVMLTRGGKVTKHQVDLPGMYRSGNLKGNIEVHNGDTIFVQPAPVFYIYGEVQRAGAYRLQPNMAVMQALSLGGGLTPRGTERGMKIKRRMPDGSEKQLDASLSDKVQPDDVIYVRESLF